MSLDEDELLASALGVPAARRLRKNVLEVDLTLAMPPAAAAERVRQVLGDLGSELDSGAETEVGDLRIVGIMGAGVGNLNPAVVTVTIRAAENDSSNVVVRGAAKEGLIKQRAGESAARRVAGALA
jgi:hypothetical protein